MPNKNKNTGNEGELLAKKWLEAKGYLILHTNWRYKKSEVDIIALLHNTIHFIEVKTRTQQQFGLPEESITTTKMNALKKAAVAFMEAHTTHTLLQFDVLAITLQQHEQVDYFFIEDVFF